MLHASSHSPHRELDANTILYYLNHSVNISRYFGLGARNKTTLIKAVKNGEVGKMEKAEKLFENAKIYMTDSGGRTALHYAA